MTIKRLAPFAVAALLALGAAGFAVAKDSDQDARDTAALASMKITLQQAIATAEQQEGGRAVGADIAHEKGPMQIAVEVVAPKGVRTVMVDAQSGKVTATRDGGQDSED